MGAAVEVVKAGEQKQTGMARYSEEQLKHLKNFIAPGFDDSELAFFLAVAEAKKLNPFTRQVHAVKRKLRGQDERGQWVNGAITRIDVMTGIDGYRAIAARCGDYAPGDESVQMDNNGWPISATVTVRKLIQGHWQTFSATAYFDEYAPKYEKNGQVQLGEMWRKMPRRMITKCAEALALRKGWPEELSDIYSSEEMERATTEEQSAGGQFSALVQEQPPQATPAPAAALPPPQVVQAPPPAAKPVQQAAPAPQPAPEPKPEPAKVVDMQQARQEAQRPVEKKAEALPELWAVNDPIPPSILLWLKPLQKLADKPVHTMDLAELELVIETVKRGYEAAKNNPKTTQRLLKTLMEIAGSAQYTYNRKAKGAPAQDDAPPLSDADMPAGA
jgi:phage recombination protein Bet